MTKYQQKTLTGGNPTTTDWLTTLQFNNLDQSKIYRVTAHMFLGCAGSSTGLQVDVYNGGTSGGDKLVEPLLLYNNPSSDQVNTVQSKEVIFKPKTGGDNTLKFYLTVGGAGDFLGGSSRSYVVLEELNMHEEVSIW